MALHNDCIGMFNDELYSDIFTSENVTSKKKCITLEGQKYYGFFMEKGTETYFCPDMFMTVIPFKNPAVAQS